MCPWRKLSEGPLRRHWVKARMRVHAYPDGAPALFHGPHCIARYTAAGEAIAAVPTAAA